MNRATSPRRNTSTSIQWGGVGAFWLAAMITFAAGTPGAAAHEFEPERTMLVQGCHDRLEVMIVYLEPPGPTVDLTLARFDLDGDGELTGPEARLAGGEWLSRALHGLQFEVEGESPRPRMPDIKFRREPAGALSAAVYARWDLEPLTEGDSREIHVRLAREASNFPTELNVQGCSLTEVTRLDLPQRFVGAPHLPVIRSGETATLHLRRSQSNESPPTGDPHLQK